MKINDKEFYRFIEFTMKMQGTGLTHERIKQIIKDKTQALSVEEKEVRNLTDAFTYIVNNVNQTFSKETINKSYYMLNLEVMDEEKQEEILKTYYKYSDESIYLRVAKIQNKIIKLNINKKIEYSLLLANLIMLKKSRGILITYPNISEIYKEALINRNEEKLMLLFIMLETISNSENESKEIDVEKINEYIKRNKNYILARYHVEKLYLYGSFAKNTMNKNSDVDFLVMLEEDIINIEKERIIKELTEYLTKEIGIKVDIIDFTHAMKVLEINEMENIITLI